jgi:hypothetical protein
MRVLLVNTLAKAEQLALEGELLSAGYVVESTDSYEEGLQLAALNRYQAILLLIPPEDVLWQNGPDAIITANQKVPVLVLMPHGPGELFIVANGKSIEAASRPFNKQTLIEYVDTLVTRPPR